MTFENREAQTAFPATELPGEPRDTWTAPPTVMILGGVAESLWNFRGPLIERLAAENVRVAAAAGQMNHDHKKRIEALGATVIEVPVERTGTNPFADLKLLLSLIGTMRQERPDVFLGYTVKPVVFGTIAARLTGVRHRVAMIEGLGFAFNESPEAASTVGKVVRALYRFALRFANKVVFLNEDDRSQFVSQGYVTEQQAVLIDGTGVNIEKFQLEPLPPDGPFTFGLIARLIYEKGLRIYVDAARIVRQAYPDTRFMLAGPFEPGPGGATQEEVESWSDVVEYVGTISDVPGFLRACHVFVLPSYYREGVPRTILEAMSMGRPVIVSDGPGCRVTVQESYGNGLLVQPRDSEELADAMVWAIENRDSLEKMGRSGRQLVLDRFEEQRVTEALVEKAHLIPSRKS